MTCFRGAVLASSRVGKWEGRVTLLLLPFSQTPSAENTRYAKVPCFGVVCSEPHHLPQGWGTAGLLTESPTFIYSVRMYRTFTKEAE